jgi:RTX calcium-binding nonapeptide repeat (4 copies)
VVRGGDGDDYIMSPDTGRDRLHGDGGQDFVEARGRGSAIGGGRGDDYLVAELGA